jgi:hypothetical protein
VRERKIIGDRDLSVKHAIQLASSRRGDASSATLEDGEDAMTRTKD